MQDRDRMKVLDDIKWIESLELGFFRIDALRRVALILCFASSAFASTDNYNSASLFEMDIEQLMSLVVTSVSKKSENRMNAAAAIYVVTAEDIRRMGATSLPEILRTVPGMEVARINANQYAITARGHNDQYSEKLLVLVDGREIYTPSFSGVWWVAQHVPLEDVDRIEVIRGPGASLWGSNAVNGVVNVITRAAGDSQGALISAVAGNEERGSVTARYGGRYGANGYYRVYGTVSERDGGVTEKGDDLSDNRSLKQVGFRTDWSDGANLKLSAHGDLYDIEAGARGDIVRAPGVSGTYENRDVYQGANIVGLMERSFPDGSGLSLKLYHDHTVIDSVFFTENRDTSDMESQLDLARIDRHEISAGANYRRYSDNYDSTDVFSIPDRDYSLFGTFVQDKITLIEDRWKLVAGSRLEHNDFTGWETEPNMRTVWEGDRWTMWGSVARAVRLPNRIENGMNFDYSTWIDSAESPPMTVRIIGDGRTVSEKVTAWETGLRITPANNFGMDIAIYYNEYDQLVNLSLQEGDAFFDEARGQIVIPAYLDNVFEGSTYGGEISLDYQPTSWLRLAASLSQIRYNLSVIPEKENADTLERLQWENQGNYNQYHLRAYLDLPRRLQLDTALYFSSYPDNESIDDYLRLDMRLGWRPGNGWDISLVGRNLLEERHKEYDAQFLETNSWIERSFLFKITYRIK